MSRWRVYWMLGVLLLTLAGSSSLAWGHTPARAADEMCSPTPSPAEADERCSPSPTPPPPTPPAQLSCAKTGASLCVCSLNNRSVEKAPVEGEFLPRPMTVARARRPAPKLRIVAQPQPAPMASAESQAPPTPPPRATSQT